MTAPQDDERAMGTGADAGAAGDAGATADASAIADASATADASAIASDDDALRALEPAEIRARRRPRAVAYAWLWQLACGVLLAVPIHAWARRVWGTHPDGDAVLFRPGGSALLAWLGADDPSLAIVVRTTFLTLLVLAVVGQIVTGALVASLATGMGASGRPSSGWVALRAGFASLWPLLGIGALATAIEAFVLGTGFFASSAVYGALQESLGDARAFTARMIVMALFGAATLLVGVVADLGRVAIARDVALATAPIPTRTRLRDGVLAALRATRTALGRASLAWGWRAALGLGLVYVGAVAGDVVGGRGGAALVALFVVHQLIVLARATLRTSWLANALRLVGTGRSEG